MSNHDPSEPDPPPPGTRTTASTTPEATWLHLSHAQADGLACVVCDRDDLPRVPVGRSHTGSQVFACEPDCHDIATTLIERAAAATRRADTSAGPCPSVVVTAGAGTGART